MCLLSIHLAWTLECASLSESPVASVNGRPRRRCSQACACAACAREVRLAGQPSHGVTVLAPVTRRPPGFGTNANARKLGQLSSVCRIRKLTNSSPSENPYALRGWATNCGPHASPHLALAHAWAHALALALVGSGLPGLTACGRKTAPLRLAQ